MQKAQLRTVIASTKTANYFSLAKEHNRLELLMPELMGPISYDRLADIFIRNLKKENKKRRISSDAYGGPCPDMPEFKTSEESCIRVRTNGAGISFGRETLKSESFTQCIALLLKNDHNGQAALFHIVDTNLDGTQPDILGIFMNLYLESLEKLGRKILPSLREAVDKVCRYDWPSPFASREDLQLEMEKLNSDGKLRGQFIYGKIGRISISYLAHDSTLQYFGVAMDSDIYVDSERWGIAYKPGESKIHIDSQCPKNLIKYPW